MRYNLYRINQYKHSCCKTFRENKHFVISFDYDPLPYPIYWNSFSSIGNLYIINNAQRVFIFDDSELFFPQYNVVRKTAKHKKYTVNLNHVINVLKGKYFNLSYRCYFLQSLVSLLTEKVRIEMALRNVQLCWCKTTLSDFPWHYRIYC